MPLAELDGVLREIDAKIAQPFVLEGMVGKGDRVVLLGFIPHDSRTFAFNAAFALSLSVIAIAKRHGGAAYSTGLYFRREAPTVLGEDRLRALTAFKTTVDPGGLMNPNKVLGRGVIDVLMGTASALEPLVRPIANRMRPPAKQRPKERHGIPADVGYLRVRLRAVRLLRPHLRGVLGSRLDEPFAARQVPVPARGDGGEGEVRPAHGRHVPRMHHVRGLQHPLSAAAAGRAFVDEDARQARQGGGADDVPAVRDDGGLAPRREQHLGWQAREARRLGPGRYRAQDQGERAGHLFRRLHGELRQHRRRARPPSSCSTGRAWSSRRSGPTRRVAASR